MDCTLGSHWDAAGKRLYNIPAPSDVLADGPKTLQTVALTGAITLRWSGRGRSSGHVHVSSRCTIRGCRDFEGIEPAGEPASTSAQQATARYLVLTDKHLLHDPVLCVNPGRLLLFDTIFDRSPDPLRSRDLKKLDFQGFFINPRPVGVGRVTHYVGGGGVLPHCDLPNYWTGPKMV